MRAFAVLAAIAALFALAVAQTPMTCPANFVPADACTQGPCRCAQFNTILVKSDPNTSPLQTTIKIRVTNICDQPVYYVQFAISDPQAGRQLTVLNPTGTTTGTVYSWTKSIYDGTVAPQSTPALRWLRFTPVNTQVPPRNSLMKTPTTSLPYDEFQFTVTGYFPTFRWYYQLHQGPDWDTYGPIDNSLCQCGNCDAGFAQRVISACTLGYPAASSFNTATNKRPTSVFNENESLYAFQIEGNQLELFYSDEHALTLGIRQVTDLNGKVTDYPITPKPTSPICVSGASLLTGTTIFDGTSQQAGVDGNAAGSGCSADTTQFPCGRPLTPVLFITDITGNANSRTGDWQFGGTAHLPQKVCGLWKSGTKRITGMRGSGPAWNFDLTLEGNPTPANINAAKTGWNLGAGADPVPLNNIMAGSWVQAFGAEIAWNLDNLNLAPASKYRFHFIVHDGDQTRTGGDVGQACINVEPACPAGFTGANCDVCDLRPQPGDGSYTYFCFPTGITSNPYTLLKIPTSKLSDPLYLNSGGFIPGTNATDAQGYTVTCNCRRIIKTCPSACCGRGICNQATGICDCTGVVAVVDQTTCCTGNVPPPNCLNDGYYCSNHGYCDGAQCICNMGADGTPDWSGPACNISVPKTKTCEQLAAPDCQSCSAAANANGIYCTWCTAYPLSNATGLTVGSCVTDGACTLNMNPSCTILTTYIPEPCPDDCSGHGDCKNFTCPTAGVDSASAPPPQCNGNTTWYLGCVCYDKYSGINCGAVDNIVEIVVPLSVAAIIGIIIAIIVVIAALGGGGFAIAQNMAAAPVAPAYNNPLYTGAGRSGTNPLSRMS